MSNENKEEHHHEEPDYYNDPGILSGHAPVPKWLILTYIILPIWGVICLYVYWNGSHGWLDRGYWQQLQRASNTTHPVYNVYYPDQNITKESVEKQYP